jgi:hypothetical protein
MTLRIVSTLRLVVVAVAALACNGCILIAYSLPGDQYELRLALAPTPGAKARGDLVLEDVGRDITSFRGHISGLVPGHVYQIHMLVHCDCDGADHRMSEELPQIAQPPDLRENGLPGYRGPLPKMIADAKGEIDVDVLGTKGGWSEFDLVNGTPSAFVLAEAGASEWIACGRSVAVKTREAWAHPTM